MTNQIDNIINKIQGLEVFVKKNMYVQVRSTHTLIRVICWA